MTLSMSIIGIIAVVALFLALWIKSARERRELELSSISAEILHAMMSENRDVLIFDVRQPLDVLTTSEMIPGATRIPPKEVLDNPSVIPRDKDIVVYCTCPSDETSRRISRRAHALHFDKVKFLKGGLTAWKQNGYAVEPYRDSFHLDTAQ